MEEEQKVPPNHPPVHHPGHHNPWLFFKNQYEDIVSKVNLRKTFYEESKKNAKKVRSNKKNPTKNPSYYSMENAGNASPIHPSKCEDHIYQTAIPNTITYTYEGLGSRIYNCKFTNNGEKVLVTSQTGTSFFSFTDDNKIALSKVIACNNINWAITDSDLSSNNKFMIHSTLSPYIHMFDVEKAKYIKQFNLKTGAQNGQNEEDDEPHGYFWYNQLRVFSLKLSGDNKEVIAGCGRGNGGAPIQVFDIEQNKVKHSIIAHKDDINSICYMDRENSSIFVSGSDDGKCKLWDTRILEDNKPVGIFYGHFCGLTSVSSKEDNRYFISNSKDQSIKLWDIRKSVTEEKKFPYIPYDYRYYKLGPSEVERIKEIHKGGKLPDQSVMTFWGHTVRGTLIRCHFSPQYGTGQRYIYTGSADGKVYIFDTVSGESIACLNLPKGARYDEPIVRDCAWHPYSQNFISTCFEGEIHRWEYMDLRDAEKIEEEEEWETDEEDVEGDDGENLFRMQGEDDDYDEEQDEEDEEYTPEEEDNDDEEDYEDAK